MQAILNGQDTTSYLAKTYQWILAHPTAFRDGDVFSPASEPGNAGILPYVVQTPWQFPSLAAYNQWLADITVVCRLAFQRIGKLVFVGLMAPGGARAGASNEIFPATAHILGSPLSQDDYTQGPATIAARLTQMHQFWGSDMVLSEWGANAEQTDQAAAATIDAMYTALPSFRSSPARTILRHGLGVPGGRPHARATRPRQRRVARPNTPGDSAPGPNGGEMVRLGNNHRR